MSINEDELTFMFSFWTTGSVFGPSSEAPGRLLEMSPATKAGSYGYLRLYPKEYDGMSAENREKCVRNETRHMLNDITEILRTSESLQDEIVRIVLEEYDR